MKHRIPLHKIHKEMRKIFIQTSKRIRESMWFLDRDITYAEAAIAKFLILFALFFIIMKTAESPLIAFIFVISLIQLGIYWLTRI